MSLFCLRFSLATRSYPSPCPLLQSHWPPVFSQACFCLRAFAHAVALSGELLSKWPHGLLHQGCEVLPLWPPYLKWQSMTIPTPTPAPCPISAWFSLHYHYLTCCPWSISSANGGNVSVLFLQCIPNAWNSDWHPVGALPCWANGKMTFCLCSMSLLFSLKSSGFLEHQV